MATSQHIEPFPSDIDRIAFGHWLSGFTDGEGSFVIRAFRSPGRNTFNTAATFKVALRADDLPILLLIRSFLGCGYILHNENVRSKFKSKPVETYLVAKTSELVAKVIAHYDAFPLRAKKANDYRIWREAVLLKAHVLQRPLAYRPGHAPNRHGGTFPRWPDQDREHYRHLVATLRQQRAYNSERDN